MRELGLLLLTLIIAALATGCCTYTRHGDGVIRCCPPLVGYRGEKDYRLYLPWVDLRTAGIHRFHVPDLPELTGSFLFDAVSGESPVFLNPDS